MSWQGGRVTKRYDPFKDDPPELKLKKKKLLEAEKDREEDKYCRPGCWDFR